jgi:hypothetical protein
MTIADRAVEDREYRPFAYIRDNYPQYLFTLDPLLQSVYEKPAYHFALKESTPFGIICSGIRTTPETPFPSLGNERRLKP